MFRPLIAAALLMVLSGCAHKNTEDTTGLPEQFIVYYQTNSADLTPDGYNIVQRAALAIAAIRPQAVEIAGFSDQVGSEAANHQIAEHRAVIVTKTLVDLGVDAGIITTLPLGPAHDEYGPIGDRRLEIHLIKDNAEPPGPVEHVR